jgi:hypothetical protein
MTLKPYLDTIDATNFEPRLRELVAGSIIPKLLTIVGACGLSVAVAYGTDTLADFHAKRTDGGALFTLLDPDRWTNDRGHALSFFLLDEERIVGAVGSALLWVETSLAEELESGRFLGFGGRLEPSPASAREAKDGIKSCFVVYSGGGFMNPQYRGRGCYKALWRLLQIKILLEWKWSWHLSFIRQHSAQVEGWDPLEISVGCYDFTSIQPWTILRGNRDYLVTSSRRETWGQVLALK